MINYCIFSLLLFLFGACQYSQPVKSDEKLSNKKDTLATSQKNGYVEKSPFTKNYVMGKFAPDKHVDFVKIAAKYTNKNNIYLHKDAYKAFVKLEKAAKNAGFTLTIISAARNFNYQKSIWEAKWNGKREVNGKNLAKAYPDAVERAKIILNYSSMPGTSRHHWGTDIDLNALTNSYFEQRKGKLLYNWLKTNAPKYGFCQPYTLKGIDRMHGYNQEKWHWSYMPISRKCIEFYNNSVTYKDISGFDGAKTAKDVKAIAYYVNGISELCK